MSNKIPSLGVCYYPEHWPKRTWAKDAKLMRSLGLDWVRIGEFAWSIIEPKPGVYNWQWLDEAVDTLGKAGLKVVMCTPSATPPIWMIKLYPDMQALDYEGRLRTFGSRRHYCFSHAKYRTKAAQMAELLAKRYADNKYIKAWQIDNEFSCHQTTLSYSNNARLAFRKWLADKYSSIEALNKAWGNVFWSMLYLSFDDIDLPNSTVTEANPAHWFDFKKFSSDQVVKFNQKQVEKIIPFSKKPLIHNYMGLTLSFDHFKMGDDLQIASWDSYPLGFLDIFEDDEDKKKFFRKQGDPDFQAFYHDLYRNVGKGRFWIMEQQPGPVNWAHYNAVPLDGMVRLWSLEAIAHGAEVVSYFRFRQLPFAQEQMHSGLLNIDNSKTQASKEISQIVKNDLPKFSSCIKQAPKVALVFDYESAWAWEIQPQGKSFKYLNLVFEFYKTARSLGLSFDIIPKTTSSFDKYALVIIPGLMTLSKQIIKAAKNFKGSLLIGPRFNTKNADFSSINQLNFAGLDIKTEKVESFRKDVKLPIENKGSFINWFEYTTTNNKILLKSDSLPALINHQKNYYVCGWPDQKGLINIIKIIAKKQKNLELINLPKGLRRQITKDHVFWFNYTNQDIKFKQKTIKKADVLIEKLT